MVEAAPVLAGLNGTNTPVATPHLSHKNIFSFLSGEGEAGEWHKYWCNMF